MGVRYSKRAAALALVPLMALAGCGGGDAPGGSVSLAVRDPAPSADEWTEGPVCDGYEVPCDETCDGTRAFGDIVGNPNLCNGSGPPHVPVHVRGEFGDGATLDIRGPGGFHTTGFLRRAGRSCNYHYNWNTDGDNGGAGTYDFHVTGNNGATFDFSASLYCP